VIHGTVTGGADRPGRGGRDTQQQAAARARWGNLSPRKLVFLTVFAASGNISRACRQIGANRATHYDWLAADPDYAAAFAEAAEEATETLEAEAWRRAMHGVTKPMVSKGAVVCYVQEYSDMLMVALLAARRPEKYGKQRVEYSRRVDNAQTLRQEEEALRKLTPEERAALRALLEKAGL
jgi:hypothetical protein